MTAVTEVQSASFGLMLHVQHIFAISSHHLRVTSYSFPFHVHILCIWHATELANTAVVCMHVRIVCLLVCSASW